MANECGVSVIAEFLGLTVRRVQQLVAEGMLPRPARGKYNFIHCGQAYIAYLKKLAEGRNKEVDAERARKVKLEADLAEIELRKEQGKLVDAIQAAKLWEKMIMAFRSRMLALPTKAAPQVFGCASMPEIKEVLEGAVSEALGELAAIEPASLSDEGKGGNGSAAPKADNKPVGRRKARPKPGVKRGARKVANRKG